MSAHKSVSKVPEYAQQFRKEWLYIRGINKIIESLNRGKYDYYPIGKKFSCLKADKIKNHINTFLKAQERGRLQKDISYLGLSEEDVHNIFRLEEDLEIYSDVFYACYEDGIPVVEFEPGDKIKFDNFCESFEKFKIQLKPVYHTFFKLYNNFMNSDNDSLSDSEDSD